MIFNLPNEEWDLQNGAINKRLCFPTTFFARSSNILAWGNQQNVSWAHDKVDEAGQGNGPAMYE